jgi:hypothetical protein
MNYFYSVLIVVKDQKTNETIEEFEEWHLNDHTLNCISDDIAELMKEAEDD